MTAGAGEPEIDRLLNHHHSPLLSLGSSRAVHCTFQPSSSRYTPALSRLPFFFFAFTHRGIPLSLLLRWSAYNPWKTIQGARSDVVAMVRHHYSLPVDCWWPFLQTSCFLPLRFGSHLWSWSYRRQPCLAFNAPPQLTLPEPPQPGPRLGLGLMSAILVWNFALCLEVTSLRPNFGRIRV